MVDEWPLVTIGELADSISDTHKRSKDNLIFLNTSDILLGKILHHSYSAVRDWPGQAKKSIRRDDILFSEIRPANGRWAQVGVDADDYVVSTKLMVIRGRKNRIVPRFLYHFLTSSETTRWLQHLAESRSGTFPQITFDQVAALELALPPLGTQATIANFLDCITNKIELNRRMNEMLEAIARALFKSWFVDFDPVHAKVENRDGGLPRRLADLFPARLADGALGGIPDGWKVDVLDNVLAELEVGSRPKCGVSGYSEGIPSIGAESIVGLGIFDYSKTKYIPREFFDHMTKGHVKSRDVLLYKDGGRPGEFEPHVTLFGDGFPFEVCAINEHVYRLRARPEIGQNFLFFWLSSDFLMDEMRNKGTGVAIPGLNSTQVRSLTVLVPPREVISAFDQLVEPWTTRILANCNESRTLGILRDTLLPRLISGELRIPSVRTARQPAATSGG